MGRLTIADLEKSNIGEVYVLNKTSGRNAADLSFVVPGVNGGQGDSILVPATWIPMDLTIFATRQQLINSVPFRRMVHEGYLEIMSADEAQKILATADAREEMDSVRRQRNVADALSARPEVVVGGEDVVDPAQRRLREAAKTSAGAKEDPTQPDAIVEQLVHRLQSEEISEGQLVGQLRMLGEELTVADFRYMFGEIKKDKYPRVFAFLVETATARGDLAVEVDAATNPEAA